ncbi:uncharacterized protein LOC125178358 [Hyalella azteca]|uniref:Uncharacterized protein LOC125178358 n=1 Tax=Hyalella azteca TaxID=294128 RepID=A0A979FMY5_HYAAZ|nr:uncharacterized protein LOC125178358 [Hyalella azteca]
MVKVTLATLGRRKIINYDSAPLPRVLGLLDLTTLGIGTTIGVGFYILAGDVAQHIAGPAVVISFLIAAITSVFAVVLAFGVKESSLMNTIVTIINMCVVIYVIIAAATLGETRVYWPYNMCVVIYVIIAAATLGEEAIRPERNLPLSICISLFVIFLAYFGIGTVLTLALPYCMQDPGAPLIYLYDYYGMNVSKNIVSFGALFGFSASLFGAIFPMPRIIYAMAADGLLFRSLARVSERFQSPVVATFVSGVFAAMMAMLFDLDQLINMMSIGTLQAYTIVALCVMLLRYSDDPEYVRVPTVHEYGYSKLPLFGAIFPMPRIIYAMAADGLLFRSLARVSERFQSPVVATFVSGVFAGVLCFTTTLLFTLLGPSVVDGDAVSIFFCSLCLVLSIIVVASISRQPRSKKRLAFESGCFAIYFFYGICHVDPEQTTGRESVTNPAFEDDNPDPEVPKILVQQPTPHPSRPHTPTPDGTDNKDPGISDTKEPVTSPLGTEELAMVPLVTEELVRQMPQADDPVTDGMAIEMENSDQKIVQKEEALLGYDAPPAYGQVAEPPVGQKEPSAGGEEQPAGGQELSPGGQEPPTGDQEPSVPNSALVAAPLVRWSLSDDEPDDGIRPEDVARDEGNEAALSSSASVTHQTDPVTHQTDPVTHQTDPVTHQTDTVGHQTDPVTHQADPLTLLAKSSSVGDVHEDIEAHGPVSSSVPSTPLAQRPGPLIRNSSFDSIPPSSPTDPLAKRVNEFLVIPVKEPFDGLDVIRERGESKLVAGDPFDDLSGAYGVNKANDSLNDNANNKANDSANKTNDNTNHNANNNTNDNAVNRKDSPFDNLQSDPLVGSSVSPPPSPLPPTPPSSPMPPTPPSSSPPLTPPTSPRRESISQNHPPTSPQ